MTINTHYTRARAISPTSLAQREGERGGNKKPGLVSKGILLTLSSMAACNAKSAVRTLTKDEWVPEAAPEAEFEIRYAGGFSNWEACDNDTALTQFIAAYVLARELNNRAGEADALNMTGVCYKHKGDIESAGRVFECVAQLCAKMCDTPGEVVALGNLSQALAAQQRFAEAETACERSLKLAMGENDKSAELSACFHLGTLRLRARRFTEAEAILCSARASALSLENVAAEVSVLQRLAAAREVRLQLQMDQQLRRLAKGSAGMSPLQLPTRQQGISMTGTAAAGSLSFVSASEKRRLAVEQPAGAQQPPSPPPPLEPPRLLPLQLVERAERLTRFLEDGMSPLRMQVLRQLRAQYDRLADADAVKSCERAIDVPDLSARLLRARC